MLVIIKCYDLRQILSLVDEHTFCITVLGPIAFNYYYWLFKQNAAFPVLVICP